MFPRPGPRYGGVWWGLSPDETRTRRLLGMMAVAVRASNMRMVMVAPAGAAVGCPAWGAAGVPAWACTRVCAARQVNAARASTATAAGTKREIPGRGKPERRYPGRRKQGGVMPLL